MGVFDLSKMFVSTEFMVDGRKLRQVKSIFDFNSDD